MYFKSSVKHGQVSSFLMQILGLGFLLKCINICLACWRGISWSGTPISRFNDVRFISSRVIYLSWLSYGALGSVLFRRGRGKVGQDYTVCSRSQVLFSRIQLWFLGLYSPEQGCVRDRDPGTRILTKKRPDVGLRDEAEARICMSWTHVMLRDTVQHQQSTGDEG